MIRLHCMFLFGCRLQILFQIQSHILRFFRQIPHFQKHDGKSPDRFTGEHQSCILPVSETFLYIYIFIRKINASGKSYLSIDHNDLAVIPVIVMCGEYRIYRRKYLAANTHTT